jgi:hypothetical protein
MQMSTLRAQGEIDAMIYYLSRGPDPRARVFNRCFINGFLFRVSSIENCLTTQNSGVFVKGDANTGNMGWYGVLKKIICLDFHGDKEVMLFQCVWFDVPAASSSRSRGYTKDKYGVIDIDITRFRYSDEPYILSTQAEQVFYARKRNQVGVLSLECSLEISLPCLKQKALTIWASSIWTQLL